MSVWNDEGEVWDGFKYGILSADSQKDRDLQRNNSKDNFAHISVHAATENT